MHNELRIDINDSILCLLHFSLHQFLSRPIKSRHIRRILGHDLEILLGFFLGQGHWTVSLILVVHFENHHLGVGLDHSHELEKFLAHDLGGGWVGSKCVLNGIECSTPR